ncbi:MAG: tRNA preQ1(34) S-adenosylmethionine ribosyltransferase-isomerase QueA [Candidatus Omnitrophota bacterium]
MKLSEFDYRLPGELIAQEPIRLRDESRLLVANRKDKRLKEAVFKDIVELVNKDDVLVLNDTKVLPARLIAAKLTGARLEILLLSETEPGVWEALVKPGKRARPGDNLLFAEGRFCAEVLERTPAGGRLLRFNPPDTRGLINQYGQPPLPHYIKKELKEPGRYQTVYAKKSGAVAAPTAGLHFTTGLLEQLTARGVRIACVTLHCGLATFRPVKTPDIREHPMGVEFYEVSSEAARIINKAKQLGRRIIAVGTTAVRAAETAAIRKGGDIYQLRPQQGSTGLYIYPGYKFKIIDALLTNFHLPCSTNLILVSAFGGIDFIRRAYRYAINKRFRFYSFGDAMFVV